MFIGDFTCMYVCGRVLETLELVIDRCELPCGCWELLLTAVHFFSPALSLFTEA